MDQRDALRNFIQESDKWIQGADMKKGALHQELGIPEGEKIPYALLRSKKLELQTKAQGGKTLSDKESTTLKRVGLALTLRKM
jgi:hypothetical protein